MIFSRITLLRKLSPPLKVGGVPRRGGGMKIASRHTSRFFFIAERRGRSWGAVALPILMPSGGVVGEKVVYLRMVRMEKSPAFAM